MNRRNFLHGFGVGAAVSALPVTNFAVTRKNDVVGPVMLERVCDREKSKYSAEEWQEIVKLRGFTGCGTRFRWYLGVPCMCPHCGWMYQYTHEDLKKKLYFVNAHS